MATPFQAADRKKRRITDVIQPRRVPTCDQPASDPLLSRPLLLQKVVDRLGTQEFRRRLWHYLPGFLALVLIPIPHRDPIRLGPMLIVMGLTIFLPLLFAIRYHKTYCRHPEESRIPILLGYVVPVSFLALFFRGHSELALAVATMIAFGDGSATLIGLLRRGARLPWNPRKTWAGLTAFILFGSLIPAMVYRLEAVPQVSFATALLCVGPVAILCAFIETLPLRMNDNLSVGLSSAALLILMQTLVIGW